MWSLLKSVGPSKAPRRPQGLKKLGLWRELCFLAHWLHFSPPYLELSIYLTAPCKGDQNSSEGTIPVKTWDSHKDNSVFSSWLLVMKTTELGGNETPGYEPHKVMLGSTSSSSYALCLYSFLLLASLAASHSSQKVKPLFNHFYWHITTLTSPDTVIKLQVLASRLYVDLKCSF